jgi:hypothetical protein
MNEEIPLSRPLNLTVELEYYRPTGKWYANAEMKAHFSAPMYEIHEMVRHTMETGLLPGLMYGHSEFMVRVNVPRHPHNFPHIIIPRGMRQRVSETEYDY